MHAKLASPITSATVTITARPDGDAAVATVDATSDTAPVQLAEPFATLPQAEGWADALRRSLIAAGLQDITADI